jgi:NAD(P)-dependent dehydrogenase (short-subunit alcohol dehydrogenase family)
METVLVIGATGNIGVSAVKGALNSGRNVLAIVRNQASADKLVRHIGSDQGVTFVEASVAADDGVQGVVDRVRAGELPGFQHVYSCGKEGPCVFGFRVEDFTPMAQADRPISMLVGGEYITLPMTDITTERLRANMTAMFEAAFCKSRLPISISTLPQLPYLTNIQSPVAYRATLPYLLSQPNPTTWTLCTGAQGDIGTHALPAMSQGALFSFATAACRETAETNVRFNEVYLALRVEVDEDAKAHGVTSASEFAGVYEAVLGREEIRSSRVCVEKVEDLRNVRFTRKF